MTESTLLAELAPTARIALAYAQGCDKANWIMALLLDQRLAGILRTTREPLLAQLKLAWWRERLAEDRAIGSKGEPLLAMLRGSTVETSSLTQLVDGWEALLGEAPLPRADLLAAAAGRGEGLLAAVAEGERGKGRAMAQRWALADLALHVSHPEERAVLTAAYHEAAPGGRLPRALRPLVVLHGLARRDLQRLDSNQPSGLGGLLLAMRLGLLGR